MSKDFRDVPYACSVRVSFISTFSSASVSVTLVSTLEYIICVLISITIRSGARAMHLATRKNLHRAV